MIIFYTTMATLVIFLIGVALTSILRRKRETLNKSIIQTNNEQTQIEQLLDIRIKEKKRELKYLMQQISFMEVNNSVNLTHLENNVLDTYETSHIKIPVEIIEDVHAQRFDNESDIYEYIELQRHHWKLENSKKVYRKVVK